jgi:hypothetical protein
VTVGSFIYYLFKAYAAGTISASIQTLLRMHPGSSALYNAIGTAHATIYNFIPSPSRVRIQIYGRPGSSDYFYGMYQVGFFLDGKHPKDNKYNFCRLVDGS